jgi:hypothetical protein
MAAVTYSVKVLDEPPGGGFGSAYVIIRHEAGKLDQREGYDFSNRLEAESRLTELRKRDASKRA